MYFTSIFRRRNFYRDGTKISSYLQKRLELPMRQHVSSKDITYCYSTSTQLPYTNHFKNSIEAPEIFWDELAQDITWFKKYDKVLDHTNPPFTKWYVYIEIVILVYNSLANNFT